jgi:hypothetical protein
VTLRTTTGHKRATDTLIVADDKHGGSVVSGTALDRLGVSSLTVRFGETPQGRLRIQSLDVAHPEGVTGSLLRRLPLEQIESMHKSFQGYLRRSASWYGKDSAKALAELRRLLGPGLRGSDAVYKAVADVYRIDVRNGVRNPALAISAATAVPPATVRGWIHRARLLGYLPPARRGAAG